MRVPPAELTTDRLRLRSWREGDATAYHQAFTESRDHLDPWIPIVQAGVPPLEELSAMLKRFVEDHATGKVFRWGLWVDETLVGGVLLIPRPPDFLDIGELLEIGYWLHVDHTGRGYASEAVAAMIELARPAVDQVIFRCDVRNHASQAVPKRLGAEQVTEQEVDGATLGIWRLALG